MSRDTYRERLEKYERRVQMSTWMGASLAGFIALIAAGTVPKQPDFLLATLATLLAGAAFCAAFSRVGFEWEATRITREKKTAEELDALLTDDDAPTPGCERWWRSFLWLYYISGLMFLAAVWWHPIGRLIAWLLTWMAQPECP